MRISPDTIKAIAGALAGGAYSKEVAPRLFGYEDLPGTSNLGTFLGAVTGATVGGGFGRRLPGGINSANAAERLKLLSLMLAGEQMAVSGHAASSQGRAASEAATSAAHATANAALRSADASRATADASMATADAARNSTISSQVLNALRSPGARGAGVGLGLAAGAGALSGALGRGSAEEEIGGRSRLRRGVRTAAQLAGPLALLGAVAGPYVQARYGGKPA